jgi:hypothetical protein
VRGSRLSFAHGVLFGVLFGVLLAHGLGVETYAGRVGNICSSGDAIVEDVLVQCVDAWEGGSIVEDVLVQCVDAWEGGSIVEDVLVQCVDAWEGGSRL